MSLEYRAVSAPKNFDDRNPRHVDSLMRKLVEAGLEEGWTLHGFSRESGKVTLMRRSAVATAAKRGSAGEVHVSLGGQYRASDGDKAAKLLEADPRFEGLSLVSFDPHLDQATLGKLTDQEKRVREAVAATVGAKAWDVRIESTKLGGYLMQMPGSRYSAAKHDEKLQTIAETIAGREGWFVRSDAKRLTVEFVPADPPTFEASIAYPFGKLDRGRRDDLEWVMDVPVGLALGAPGQPNHLLSIPLDGNPGALVTGTPGGGKAQPLGEAVVVPVSDRFPEGQAAIGQLRAGDHVITASGEPARIASLSPITSQPTYLLTLATGQQVRATGNHLWRVSDESMRPGSITSRDRTIAATARSYAAKAAVTHSLTQDSIAEAFGLEELTEHAVIETMLAPLSFTDGDATLYPSDEALIALAAWLEHGRTIPWRVLTTDDLIASGRTWSVPAMSPRTLPVSFAARVARADLAERLLAGTPVTLGEVRAGDVYAKQALAEEIAVAAHERDLIEGDVWQVPQQNAPLVADALRAIGLVVTDRGEGELAVTRARTIEIASIEPVGMEHARCLVLEDAEHLYATGSYVVTHNSVSINALIYGLLSRGWQIAIGDTVDKAADFEWCKTFVMPDGFGCQGPASTAAMVSMIYDLRTERAQLIKDFGGKKWQDIPDAHRPPPVCVILDEVEGLFALEPEPKSLPKDHPLRIEAAQHNYEVELLKAKLNKIVAQLRFAGVRVVLATQQAQANTGMSPAMKMKLTNRVLMGRLTNDQVRGHALVAPQQAPHVPDNLKRDERAGRGVGVAEFEGYGAHVFKSFYSDTDEYARRLRSLGVPETRLAETSQKVIDRYIDRLDEDAGLLPGEEAGFGRGERKYEAWELGPDGQPLSGFERANAAKHAATVAAKSA